MRRPTVLTRGHLVTLTFAALAVLLPSRAFGQGNAFAAPIGGRSALMGNTGIALGVDGSAPFLNPATIVRLDDHRFAFSVNFYNYGITHFADWHQPGAVDSAQFGNVGLANTAITSSGFNVLPSTLCLFFTLRDGASSSGTGDSTLPPGRQKLSLCLGSLENQGVSFTALPFNATTSLGQTAQSQSLVQSWSRFYAGPSYSISVSEHFALGLSIHGVYTSDSFILDSNAITASATNGGVASSFGAAGGGGSFDFSATLGAIYRFGAYTAGLSVAAPALHAFGSYTGTTHDSWSSGTMGSALIANGSGSFSSAPPVRVGVGLGGEWARLMLEADASLNIPAPTGFTAALSGTTSNLSGNTLTSTPFSSTFSVPEHVTVNTGMGAEYFVKPTFSIVGGASVNLTAQPPLSPTLTVGNLVQERQSMATASLGVGSYGPSGNLMLGVQFGYGWGQSLAANPYVTPNQWAVVDTNSYGVTVILAGSTSLRALGHALERIEHVIVRNPSDPDFVDPGAPATTPHTAPTTTSPKAHPAPAPVPPPPVPPPPNPPPPLTSPSPAPP